METIKKIPPYPHNQHPPQYETPGGGDLKIQVDNNQQPNVAFFIIQFEDPIVRKKFVGKVLFTVAVMISVVATITGLSYIPFFRDFLNDEENRKTNLFILIGLLLAWYIIAFVTLLVRCVRKIYPLNIIMLTLNAVLMGFVIAILTAYVPPIVVIKAACETFLILTIVAVLARYTRIDATGFGFMWKFFLISTIISCISFVIIYFYGGTSLLANILSTVMVFIYSIYIFIDLQLIMGGKRNAISPDEPVYASIMLFVDIMLLFMVIFGIYAQS